MDFRWYYLIIFLLFLSGACTGYKGYNKDEAMEFILNDSSQLVIGKDKWTGPDDCSGVVYMNKLSNGLLITVEVKDDSVRTGNEASFQNDGIELYFDVRPPRLRNRNLYEKGVFQIVIIPQPGKNNSAPVTWFPKFYNSEVTGTSAFTQVLSRGYIVQVFLPFSGLRINQYWPRDDFSIDIGINDADVVNRETQMMWKGKSNNFNSPFNFESFSFPFREEKIAKPNILLVLTDKQTIMNMSAYGNRYVHTPNMDALAEWGTRFTQSYCTSPAGSPSRSSIITGLMPHQTGVNYNGMKPDSSIKNLGHFFKEAGYRTIWAGKWHLPDEFPKVKKIDFVPGFEILPFLSPEKITRKGDDMDAQLTESIIKVLNRKFDKPFLIVASYVNPHDITEAALKPDAYPRLINILSAPPLPSNFTVSANEPEFLKDCRDSITIQRELYATRNFNKENWQNYLFNYYRMTERVDREIGKLITTLESKGLDLNTIIVFTSVQGDGAAAHQWSGGYSPYEETFKVPLIISRFGDKIQNIEDTRNLVSGIDILPTLLDYAGIEIPSTIEGMSLKPIIENPDTSWREILITEIAFDPENLSKSARVVRWKDYKYVIYSYGNSNEQLFDLQTDPGETINLAFSPKYSSVKLEMIKSLQKWMERTRDK